MNVEFQVSDQFTDAMRRLRDSRRKGGDDAKAVNAAMYALITAAMAKTPVAQEAHIAAYMKIGSRNRRPDLNRGRTATGKFANKWRNTTAAALIGSIVSGKRSWVKASKGNLQKYLAEAVSEQQLRRSERFRKQIAIRAKATRRRAKTARARNAAVDNAFYAAVESFVKRAVARRGYHKKGFIPALKALKKAAKGFVGQVMKRPPGDGKQAEKSEQIPTATMTNFARAIAVLMPAWPESDAIAILEKLIAQNLEERKKEAGLA